MGNSHNNNNSNEKLHQTSGGGGGGNNGNGENINLNGKQRRNSRVRNRVFGRFGHKKSKDNNLCGTSIINVDFKQSNNNDKYKTTTKLKLISTADNESFQDEENLEISPTISPLSADLEWNLGEKFEQIFKKQDSADTDTARDVILLDESPLKGDDGQQCNIQQDHQQQCTSNLGSEGYEYNSDYDDLDSCEVIILKEKSTSSSDSNFTDPLTPIGFSAELNECYISEENICDDYDEIPLKILNNSISKNNLKVKHKTNFINRKEDILNKLSISKIYYLNLNDTIKSDDSPEDDLEMATNLRNKLAQMLNNSDDQEQQQTMQQKNQLSTNTETMGLFNVAKAKKVELHNLSSRITDNNLNSSGTPTLNFKPQNLSTAISTPTKEILTNQNTGSFFSSFGESNVLKKVASFITAEKSGNTTPTNEQIINKTVIDKPTFSIYEKFEGQMLLKWFTNSMSINSSINEQDLNKIIIQYCTNLLSIGVFKPITEKNNKLDYENFNLYQMYEWAFKELPSISLKSGKLDTDLVWPHSIKNCNENIDKDKDDDSILNDFYEHGSGVDRKVYEIKKSLLNCKNLTELYEVIETLMPDRRPSDKIEVPVYLQQDILNETDLTLYDFDVKPKKELHKDVCIQINNITCCECNTKKPNIKYASIEIQTEEISTSKFEKENSIINDEKLVDAIIKSIDPIEKNKPPPPPPPAPPIPPPPPPSNSINDMPSSKGMIGSSTNIPVAPPIPPPNILSLNISVGPPPPPMPNSNSSNIGPPPPPLPHLNSQNSGTPTVPTAVKSDIPAPLPPPNSGSWFQANCLRKNAVNPPKPMKPLYWTRIVAPKLSISEDHAETPIETDTVDSSKTKQLWQEIEETNLDNIDEFTDLFSRQAMVPKQKTEKQQPIRVKTLKILDSKRSQNVGIFARSLHFDFEEIEHAVYHCDTSIVSLEILQHIMEIKAKPDELELIKEAASRGDTPLDPPENFLLRIAQISFSEERITCIVFQADFEEASIQIYRKLDVVKRLCQLLTDSDNLKLLFSIILTLGNYMNGGNRARGQADGFGLEILGKLKDVKSKDSKITLLHFIVKTYIDRKRKGGTPLPEVEIPIPEPSDIEKAVAVDFDEVKEQIKELNRKLNVCKSTTEKVIASSNQNNIEPFKSKMESFIEKGTRKIEKQLSKLDDCRIVFVKTMEFYDFIPRSGTLEQCTPGQFFEYWLNFTNDFKDIWKKEIIMLTNELLKKMHQQHKVKTTTAQKPNKLKPGSLKDRLQRLGKK